MISPLTESVATIREVEPSANTDLTEDSAEWTPHEEAQYQYECQKSYLKRLKWETDYQTKKQQIRREREAEVIFPVRNEEGRVAPPQLCDDVMNVIFGLLPWYKKLVFLSVNKVWAEKTKKILIKSKARIVARALQAAPDWIFFRKRRDELLSDSEQSMLLVLKHLYTARPQITHHTKVVKYDVSVSTFFSYATIASRILTAFKCLALITTSVTETLVEESRNTYNTKIDVEINFVDGTSSSFTINWYLLKRGRGYIKLK